MILIRSQDDCLENCIKSRPFRLPMMKIHHLEQLIHQTIYTVHTFNRSKCETMMMKANEKKSMANTFRALILNFFLLFHYNIESKWWKLKTLYSSNDLNFGNFFFVCFILCSFLIHFLYFFIRRQKSYNWIIHVLNCKFGTQVSYGRKNIGINNNEIIKL